MCFEQVIECENMKWKEPSAGENYKRRELWNIFPFPNKIHPREKINQNLSIQNIAWLSLLGFRDKFIFIIVSNHP